MYEWLWGHTKAQIELMMIDAPYTCYEADKDKKRQAGDKEPPSEEAMKDAVRRWEERKKTRKFKLGDFLGGSSKPVEQEQINKE